MKAFGDVRPEDIQNEIRAVDKLCKSSTHPNIVPVLKHGHMHPHYYFMDMELCDLNLESYMHQKWTAALEEKTPYFTNDLPLWMKTRQVWGIMEDIIRGVAFIHLNKEVHRDLKPQNSSFPYVNKV